MKITFINGVTTQALESDDEKVTYHPDIDEDGDSNYDQEVFDAKYNYIQLTPSNYIFVARCAFSQSEEKDDWRRTTIFHTYTKIEGKNWKVFMDSKSCVNAVSSKMIEKVDLKVIPHPNPYKVLWINFTTLDVKQCLIPIEFDVYKDKVWYDVVIIDVGQIILEQPWLYDNDVTIHDRSNICRFKH